MTARPSLKIPIARLGSWHSDRYGNVSFDQEDFNHLIQNFSDNVRGYEPYLRYGHNQKGAGIHGGERSLGFLKSMYQSGDVLWGNFEPTNDSVVEEVRNGEYRYASAELVRNAKDKATGKRLRIFLKGHSLTNEPFVPNLPRNTIDDEQYLSEEGAEHQFCILSLSELLPVMYNCSNCGCTGSEDEDGLCSTCQGAADEALKAYARPEVTTLQSILNTLKSLFVKIDNLPSEIVAVNQQLSDKETPEQVETEIEAEPDAQDDVSVEAEQEEEVVPPSQEDPSEEDSEAEAEPEESVEEDDPMTPETPETSTELETIKAQLQALLDEKAELQRIADEAKAVLQEKLEQEQEAQRIAEEEAAAQAEREFAQALSDRVQDAAAKGVPPVLAERARALVESLRSVVSAEQTFVLSEGEEPIDFIEGVFSLLSEAKGMIDFSQHGSQPSEGNTSDNPWGERIARARNSQ